MIQAISLIGAALILMAFAAAQFKLITTASMSYLLLNFVGSALLGWVAVVEGQWGFILLEVVWALISLWSIVQLLLRGRRSS